MSKEKLSNDMEKLSNEFQKIMDRFQTPLTESEKAESIQLCQHFYLPADAAKIFADLHNLRISFIRANDCISCTHKKLNCYRTVPVLKPDGRIKTEGLPCIEEPEAVRFIKYRSGVPNIYQNLRADYYVKREGNQTAIDAAEECVNNKKNLYLHGVSGTGKTLLCSLIAIERAYNRRSSYFYTVTKMLDGLGFNEDKLVREEKFRKLKESPCIIIDDLGAEYAPEWVASMLFEILDSRFVNQRQVVINSNYSLKEIVSRYSQRYGERIARRIYEYCPVVEVK